MANDNAARTTVGIIGGKGLMGSFFADFFRSIPCRVLVSDLGTRLSNRELVEQSDVILFAVPIETTVHVIDAVRPFVKPGQLLMDLTSIKTPAMRAMLKTKAAVIGLHPMFRPSPQGLSNQTIVLCRGRAPEASIEKVKRWFTQQGAKIVEMSAKKHDTLMGIIQVMIHFHTIVLGNSFRALGIPLKETLEIASPIYRLEMGMIGRIFSQNPELYASIEMENPETKKLLARINKETESLRHIVIKKDRAKFVREFNRTAEFLGVYKDLALHEINDLLTHLPRRD